MNHLFPSILAHGGGHGSENFRPHDWHELARAWEFDPLVVIGLVVTAFLYARGLRRMWRDGGSGSGVRGWEAWCYWGGWLAILIALVSPLHPWGRVLFAAHMTQHEVLMLIGAPLVVLGRPMLVYLKALPRGMAGDLARASNMPAWSSTWHAISNPFSAWLIHGVVLWVWHIPSWFQATLDNDFIHTLQHCSFLFSALLFWWAVTHGPGRAAAYGMTLLYLFTTALHNGLLGLLITVAGHVWYPAYSGTTQWWGLTPLEDQQLGGLIMWIPAGVVYIVAALAFMAGWMRESRLRAERREARERVAALSGIELGSST
jgi:cytochrome c oxidase assembly factor CtaG